MVCLLAVGPPAASPDALAADYQASERGLLVKPGGACTATMAEPTPPMAAQRIVVGVDFSRPSRMALDAAATLARALGADLTLVHAFSPAGAEQGLAGASGSPKQMAVAVHETGEALQLSTQWASEVRDAGLRVGVVTQEGQAPNVILEAAANEDAAIIVVGTHGRSGIKRALLGSVAEQVIRNSDRPVLAVPAGPIGVRSPNSRSRR